MDTGAVQHGRHGVVKGLNGPPASVEKVITPGMEFPAGGHTGETAGIAAVKTEGSFPQAPEIRGMDPGIAVIREKMPVQGVKHHHYRFHKGAPGRIVVLFSLIVKLNFIIKFSLKFNLTKNKFRTYTTIN
jgi:hypothetical protein